MQDSIDLSVIIIAIITVALFLIKSWKKATAREMFLANIFHWICLTFVFVAVFYIKSYELGWCLNASGCMALWKIEEAKNGKLQKQLDKIQQLW